MTINIIFLQLHIVNFTKILLLTCQKLFVLKNYSVERNCQKQIFVSRSTLYKDTTTGILSAHFTHTQTYHSRSQYNTTAGDNSELSTYFELSQSVKCDSCTIEGESCNSVWPHFPSEGNRILKLAKWIEKGASNSCIIYYYQPTNSLSLSFLFNSSLDGSSQSPFSTADHQALSSSCKIEFLHE